jgi:histidine ammonia-lyase
VRSKSAKVTQDRPLSREIEAISSLLATESLSALLR